MIEYRATKMPRVTVEEVRSPKANSLQELAAWYGLKDAWIPAPAQSSDQTVQSEFKEYLAAPPPVSSDPLAFWAAVSFCSRIRYYNHINHIYALARLRGRLIQPSSELQWIICQSKLRLFHVNVYSHPALKQILVDTTESLLR